MPSSLSVPRRLFQETVSSPKSSLDLFNLLEFNRGVRRLHLWRCRKRSRRFLESSARIAIAKPRAPRDVFSSNYSSLTHLFLPLNTTQHLSYTSFEMAFILRRPFSIANALKQAPKASQITFRSFQTQSASLKQAFTTSSRSAAPVRNFAKNESAFLNAFRQSSKRKYQTSAPPNPVAQGNLTQRLIYGGKNAPSFQQSA